MIDLKASPLGTRPAPGLEPPTTAANVDVAPERGQHHNSRLRKWSVAFVRTVLPPLAVFIAVIGVWLFVSYVVLDAQRRFLLPPPQDVFNVGFLQAVNRDEIFSALWSTTRVAMVGLVWAIVLGSSFAIAMSWGRWVERSFYSWAVVLQAGV